MRYPIILASALALVSVACGSRSGVGDGLCGEDDYYQNQFVRVDPADESNADSCSFEFREGTTQNRIECTDEYCIWMQNGLSTCTCDDMDFANVCANGTPVCASWRQYVDFTR